MTRSIEAAAGRAGTPLGRGRIPAGQRPSRRRPPFTGGKQSRNVRPVPSGAWTWCSCAGRSRNRAGSGCVEEGRTRLLLVEGGAAAPRCDDRLEDWIRVPVDEADVRARVDGLARRRPRPAAASDPTSTTTACCASPAGGCRCPPVEARLMSALLERYETVVSRDQLARSGWPKGAPGRNALDVHVLRLRRRIAPLACRSRRCAPAATCSRRWPARRPTARSPPRATRARRSARPDRRSPAGPPPRPRRGPPRRRPGSARRSAAPRAGAKSAPSS